MIQRLLIDAGPLVAYINEYDPHHAWARDQFARSKPPLHTCEAAATEASHLLRRTDHGPLKLVQLIERTIVMMAFDAQSEIASLRHLMAKYEDAPMSFADACLVRMAEKHPQSVVLTLDRHFKIYRQSNRHVIETIMPG